MLCPVVPARRTCVFRKTQIGAVSNCATQCALMPLFDQSHRYSVVPRGAYCASLCRLLCAVVHRFLYSGTTRHDVHRVMRCCALLCRRSQMRTAGHKRAQHVGCRCATVVRIVEPRHNRTQQGHNVVHQQKYLLYPVVPPLCACKNNGHNDAQ